MQKLWLFIKINEWSFLITVRTKFEHQYFLVLPGQSPQEKKDLEIRGQCTLQVVVVCTLFSITVHRTTESTWVYHIHEPSNQPSHLMHFLFVSPFFKTHKHNNLISSNHSFSTINLTKESHMMIKSLP